MLNDSLFALHTAIIASPAMLFQLQLSGLPSTCKMWIVSKTLLALLEIPLSEHFVMITSLLFAVGQ